jgi:hypothetical protein
LFQASCAGQQSDKKALTCCGLATLLSAYNAMLSRGWGAAVMFDIYLNDKRHLLVVRKGFPIPLSEPPSRWRKKKKVVSVSDEITRAVHKDGYYIRRLKDLKKC